MKKRNEISKLFYINDHAVLYGMLAKAADELYGAKGDAASHNATRLYASERGRRMAQRAKADNMPLTLSTYRIYTEWEDEKRRMKVETLKLSPNFRMNGTYCEWNETWKKYKLEKYGCIYCSNVDQTMVSAFNPENELIIHSTLSQGGSGCDFEWVGLAYDTPESLKEEAEKKQKLKANVVKDFLYHCGHVLSAMERGYEEKLGSEAAKAISKMAVEEYRTYFGEEKANAVTEESQLDFQTV